MSAPVLYYDLGSPYAYLAMARAPDVLGREPELAPVLLGAIFKLRGYGSWVETERRPTEVAEVERRAAAYGLPPLRWDAPWPWGGLATMRAATWAAERGAGRDFALAAYRRQFAEGRGIGEVEALAELAAEVGLPGAELPEAIADPVLKARLRSATEAAWQRGVRGVPSVAIGEQVFFGDDRLSEAAARLATA